MIATYADFYKVTFLLYSGQEETNSLMGKGGGGGYAPNESM